MIVPALAPPAAAVRPPGPAGMPLDGGLVACLRPLDPSAPWREAWAALGREAFEQNPFHEADFALAAARAFGSGVRLLIVSDRPPEAEGARLLAVWPFRRARARWGLPLPVLMGWAHGFCAYGVPLLDGAEPERALAGLLQAPRALALSPRLLMPNLPSEGAFADLLAAHLARAGTRSAAYWSHERALLDLSGLTPEERAGYLAHMPGERRRKLRQRLARLEAPGPVSFETLRHPQALAAGIEDYIALEAAGWKGRAGTAVAVSDAETAFMREMVAGLGRRGGVRIDRLRRDGRTLAASVLLSSRDTQWCLKIAHDEAVARHSPGVQLVHRVTQDILSGHGPTYVDSCAAPDYRLGEMFWTGRRGIAHRLIEADGGDSVFALAAGLERARERVARFRTRRRKGA